MPSEWPPYAPGATQKPDGYLDMGEVNPSQPEALNVNLTQHPWTPLPKNAEVHPQFPIPFPFSMGNGRGGRRGRRGGTELPLT